MSTRPGIGEVFVGSDSSPVRVLLVEDDDVIREATQLALARHGFEVAVAPDGMAGLDAFRADPPDVVLLDVLLPELDGVSLCRRIRETSLLPVLMISARGESVDVVNALEAGADDYVVKPFETSVLVARIRAVIRRSGPVAPERADSVRVVGDLAIDSAAMEVRRDGRRLDLTPTEIRLLLEFADAPGVVLSRAALLERVWDYPWGGDTRVVDVHVQRLRAKIGRDRLETVRGFGYKLRR